MECIPFLRRMKVLKERRKLIYGNHSAKPPISSSRFGYPCLLSLVLFSLSLSLPMIHGYGERNGLSKLAKINGCCQ